MTTAMIKMPPVKYDQLVLKGGWDLLTPTLTAPPGLLRDVQNFECAITGGYSRIAGYERFDGRPSPSNATYSLIQVISFTNTPSLGQTLTGFTSGASGVIVALGSSYMILTKVVGSFLVPETVKVGATVIGTSAVQSVSVSSLQNAQYQQAAVDNYRTDIGQVPGSGPVRGVVPVTFSGTDSVFAFRDNVGGTLTLLYQSSAGGWVLVPFYNEVRFTAGGTTVPADNTTLTKGGVTATIKRVVWESGSWTGGTAAGRFIITNPAGGNFSSGAATIGAINVTLSGIQTVISLLPGGKFEMVIASASGQLSSRRVFGCDNVNRGFEFDGAVFVPIETKASIDIPKHVAWHKNHLFLGIQGAAMSSGPGLPYKFLAADGGAEIDVGDTITNFIVQPGSQTTAAMEITARSGTFMLYGTGASDWNLVSFNTGTGAFDYTGQNLNESFVLDDAGVLSLSTTLSYGNFVAATLTRAIQPFITEKRTRASYSSVSRDKSQYRIWFTDGFALWVTYANGQLIGMTKIFYPDPVYCAFYGELLNGGEVSFVGASTSGYVYQTDVGASFDGKNIEAYLTLNWNPQKSPRVRKRYRRASIEMQSSFYANISVGYQLGYGTQGVVQPTAVNYPSNFAPAPAWDSFTFDNFIWDGVTLKPSEISMVGTAENLQFTISSTTNFIQPYTVNSIIAHFTPRRGVR